MFWHLCFLVAPCLAWVSVFGEGMHLVSKWVIQVLGVMRLHQRPKCNSCGLHGLAGFGSLLGYFTGVVKRVAGVGGGEESARTFCVFVTLGNRKESSEHLGITASICQSHNMFLWNRIFAGSELSRSISCFPLSRFGNTEGHGCGKGSLAQREGVPA